MGLLEGNLTENAVRSVFQVLRKSRGVGTWYVSDGRDEKIVCFDKRAVRLYASRGRQVSSMSDYLVGQNLVTREQMEVAREKSKASGGLEKALADIRALPGVRFQAKAEELIQLELRDLVVWSDAIFEFHEGSSPETKCEGDGWIVVKDVDFGNLAENVEEWLAEWEGAKISVQSELARPLVVPETADVHGKKELCAELGALLSLLNGRRSLRDLSRDSGHSLPVVVRAIDEGVREGLLEANPPSESERSNPERIVEDLEVCDRTLRSAVCPSLVHRRIATRYETLGYDDRASEHYEAIGNLQVQAGLHSKAKQSYRHALKLAPQNLSAHENLIRLLEFIGDKSAACDEVLSLSKKLVGFGMLKEAIAFLEELASKTDRISIRLYLAELLTQARRVPDAVNEYLDIARSAKRKGSSVEVAEIYRKALLVDPKNRKARRLLRHELIRKSNRRLIWFYRVPTRVAAVLIITWLASEIMARQEWETAEGEVLQVVADGRVEEGLERLRDLTKRYPGNRLVSDLGPLERSLYKQAFDEAEARMEQAVGLSNEGRCIEAVFMIERVLRHSPAVDQKIRAKQLIDDIEDFRNIWLKTRRRAEVLLEAGLRKEAFSLAQQVTENYPEGAAGLRIPLLIQTNTPGARVTVDGTLWGYTPLWIHFRYGEGQKVEVQLRGYPKQTLKNLDRFRSPYIDIDFRERRRAPKRGR